MQIIGCVFEPNRLPLLHFVSLIEFLLWQKRTQTPNLLDSTQINKHKQIRCLNLKRISQMFNIEMGCTIMSEFLVCDSIYPLLVNISIQLKTFHRDSWNGILEWLSAVDHVCLWKYRWNYTMHQSTNIFLLGSQQPIEMAEMK